MTSDCLKYMTTPHTIVVTIAANSGSLNRHTVFQLWASCWRIIARHNVDGGRRSPA